MDLNYLNNASEVVPMLVRLHDSHKLYSLAKDKKPMAQAELSAAITELIGLKTSAREEELIADVLISLMRQAETDLKAALSDRLSGMNAVPLRLALYLANEEIEVAGPMLKLSDAYSDLDLLYIIQSKSAEYWQAIAQRKELSNQVIMLLTGTGDTLTARKLMENMDIVIPKPVIETFADMAEGNDTLAKPLLHRPEINDDMAARLYSVVGQELKKHIAENFDVPMDILLGVVDEVVLEFKGISASEFTPSKSVMTTAQRHKEQGLLTVSFMVGSLRRAQIQSFIAQLSIFADTPASVVEELLGQPKGTGLAVMCRAKNIDKQDFVTMFLLTNRIREKGRMVDLHDMNRVVNYYNALTRDVAESILRSATSKVRN